jgi:hypothetical protein
MFGRKKPPQTVEQQSAQSCYTRFNPNWRFTYERKRLPDPGAQNYAYENLGLVEFSPIGAAESNRGQFRSLQPPTAYAYLSAWLQGVGGLSQGTIYGQPLIAPQLPLEKQFS